ncbi:MAG TPA: PTS sugar transporter subunit IIA [Lachnospiraceae bacterium]|nr:PTS sugar transporter subunit IIA [Lachnospiraceae bacterium]
MFLKELADKKRICFHQSFATWEEAVTASCAPLLAEGVIEQAYIDSVIGCVKKYGPYIVFAPNIAMPHSQEGAVGVHETAVSFMKVEEPVHFEDGNPDKDARLFFVLASTDHKKHMENMEKLAGMLLKPGMVDELLKVTNEEELLALDARCEG